MGIYAYLGGLENRSALALNLALNEGSDFRKPLCRGDGFTHCPVYNGIVLGNARILQLWRAVQNIQKKMYGSSYNILLITPSALDHVEEWVSYFLLEFFHR